MRTLILILGIMVASQTISAQDITLPKPKTTGGMPLMEALSKRSTTREFSKEEIDSQTLSNLLWAAWGYNREGMRTAPSANNKQCIDLYVVKKSGAYLYDAQNNKLIQVNTEDVRKSAGKQEFVWEAPLNFVYVADKDKGGMPQTDVGFIAQNVYLFCASENMAAVVRGFFDAGDVKKALKLKDNQEPVLTQTIGKKK